MDRYAVIGNPVEHSRSPFIHSRFAEQTSERLSYERILSPLDGFSETVRRFAAEGGRGCNITVPFKFEAVGLAEWLTPRAELAGAVNVLRFDAQADGGWLGDNTDGVGLVRDIEHNAGLRLAGTSLLLWGAGGAAAGALGPLLEATPRRVVIVNRTLAKAETLVRRHATLARRHGVDLLAAEQAPAGERFDVLLNATSASLQGSASPAPPSVLRDGALSLDMMYGPAARPFVAWAAQHGACGRDGLGMLVEQAAEAFRLWRGVRPDTAGVLAELRKAVDAA
jgi:shikimate dehydrogenase